MRQNVAQAYGQTDGRSDGATFEEYEPCGLGANNLSNRKGNLPLLT